VDSGHQPSSANSVRDGLGREYWSWFGFWAEFVVLGLLAIIGAYFASQGGQPGDYAAGLTLSLTAIVLAFFRLKLRFDGMSGDWSRSLLVDDVRNLVLAIAVFTALGLAGLFVAAGSEQGSLHSAGVALFVTSGLVVFLSLKNVFDNLDRRR
jgi:hypothetical protein